MRQREDAKAAALVVGIGIVLLQVLRSIGLLPEGEWTRGIAAGAPLVSRMAHPFVHAGMCHALLNVYVLWQIVFFFPIRLRHLAMAYMVACSCPVAIAVWTAGGGSASLSVVGLSGVDYVLMGKVLPYVARKTRFCAAVAGWTVLAAAVGSVAVGLHFYGFGVGVLSAMPLLLRRR